jgi:hypothetical protein
VLYAGARQLLRTHDRDEVLRLLRSHLEQAVAELARTRVFVHAGVVGWKGRAIVLPGSSHAGKSSLVAALLRLGAEYYSDEYAVIDARGRVHPFPRPLLLRDESELGRAVTAGDLGTSTGRRSLPVGIVALARYEAGAAWRPQTLTPGRAVLDLLAHTVMVRRQPEQAVSAFEQLVPRSLVVKGTRGEAVDAARWLLEAVEERRG